MPTYLINEYSFFHSELMSDLDLDLVFENSMQCVERSLSTIHNKFLQWLHGKQQEQDVQYLNELRGLGLVKYSFCRSFASQNIEVHHDKVGRKFTIDVEGHDTAFLKYTQLSSDSVDMYTTVVPTSLEGRGIAKLLANQAFQFARENELSMKLSCWYLAGYLQRHPQPDLKVLE